MRNWIGIFVLVLATCALASGAAWGVVVVAPLEAQRPDVGALFQPIERAVSITIKDEREAKSFVAGAIVGPKAIAGKGLYIGYATEKEGDLVPFLQAAANKALRVLGLKSGAGMSLEIVLRDFRVDLYRLSGFSPMNCMGYGILDATLRGADGSEVRRKSFRLAYWEDTTPVGSMKEVQKEAISRIYTHAAWEATAAILLDELQLVPNAAEIERLVKSLDKTEEGIPARGRIFWLGLSRQGGSPVKDRLLSLLRTSEEQRIYHAAAEALGKLGIAESRDEILGILSSSKKLGGWDNSDSEQVWYLIGALSNLGEAGIRARVPAGEMRMKEKVQDLVHFRETGEIPKAGAAELEKRAKAEAKLAKQRQ